MGRSDCQELGRVADSSSTLNENGIQITFISSIVINRIPPLSHILHGCDSFAQFSQGQKIFFQHCASENQFLLQLPLESRKGN